MEVKENIDHERFPKQGSYLHRRVDVCFKYNLERVLRGTIVRDDDEAPGLTIIRLDDGRHVLSTECQYSPRPVE